MNPLPVTVAASISQSSGEIDHSCQNIGKHVSLFVQFLPTSISYFKTAKHAMKHWILGCLKTKMAVNQNVTTFVKTTVPFLAHQWSCYFYKIEMVSFPSIPVYIWIPPNAVHIDGGVEKRHQYFCLADNIIKIDKIRAMISANILSLPCMVNLLSWKSIVEEC